MVRDGAIELPSAQNGCHDTTVALEEWKLVNIIHGKRVADIENRIATIEPWHSLIAAVPFTRAFVVRAGRTAVPRRAIVDRMAPCVMNCELQAPTHLFAERDLHGVVNGVVYIFPDAKFSIIRVQTSRCIGNTGEILLAAKFPAEAVDCAACGSRCTVNRSRIQRPAWNAVHLLGTE